MDRGRSPDDGPDEIEAASDNDTIDPTVEAGASLVPVEEEAAGAPDGATAEPHGAAAATGADGDGRPATWLADIRARAPWLLEPGGALQWRASAGRGPDIVPHGERSQAPSAGDRDVTVPPVAHPPGMSRVQDASSRDRNEEVGPLVQ